MFLGCHLDDVEYGCGALVCYLCSVGKEVYIAVLSHENKNSTGEIQLSRNMQEAYSAMHELGVSDGQILIGNCYGQIFDHMQQNVRDELIRIREELHPDAVFFPSKNDVHQDHEVLSRNAFRIFRGGNCYGYEVIRSSYEFQPQIYFKITKEELQRKISSIMSYKSQLTESAGYYFSEKLIEAQACFRGGQCGFDLAEAFECYRQTIVR